MRRLLLFTLSILTLLSCSHDVEDTIPADYGTVKFELTRNSVYVVSSLSTAKTIKVTVVDQDARKTVLPSLELEGTEDMIATAPYPLPAGHYIIESFRCFDIQGDIIDDLDITMTKENEFDIVAGSPTEKALSIQVKHPLTTSNLYNTLYGLCLEVLGSDKSKWPKSWDFDGDGITGDWAGLEFEWDIDTYEPIELIGIVINGEEEYIINSETWEKQLVSLPEFKHMKRLPGFLANLVALDGITIQNCDLEEIDPEFQYSQITSLTITNTHLKSIPDELGNLKKLCDVWLEGNQLSSFPEAFTRCEDMQSFVIKDEPGITSVPESIANWGTSLVNISISGTGISSLPDVFDRIYNVSMPDFSNNKSLSSLPSTIGMLQIPYSGGGYTNTGITGMILDGCAFTAIPDVLKRPRMNYISIANNAITSLSASDFDAMTDLNTLVLDGNRLASFPVLSNPKLGYLSLRNTTLTPADVDTSHLPNLRTVMY